MNICEDIKNASFVADFTAFAIPQNESDENMACQMYQPKNQDDGCIAENFGNTPVSCSSHVFSEDIPYEYTLTQQLDMPSCSNDPTWALNVRIKSSRLAKQSNGLFNPFWPTKLRKYRNIT